MNVYLPGARLPSTYQEVEWIGRNGNNYIETGWIPTTNFTVKVGYKIADSGYRYVILSQYGGGAYNHAVALEVNSGNVSNNTVRFYCGNTPTTTQFYSSNSLNLNSFNDITITAPGTINVNGTTTTNSSMYTGTYDNKTCRLFIDNDTSFSTFSHNSFISYCKIYEGSTLVRDFIPCYRKSDSVIGLYDLANNQFYTNSGTGTFTKGNDVTMSVLKNAYIGEYIPWTPDASRTLLYLPLESNATDYSGNNRSTSPSNISYGTLGGINTAYNSSGNGYIRVTPTDIVVGSTEGTVSMLVYYTGSISDYRIAMNFNRYGSYGLGIGLYSSKWTFWTNSNPQSFAPSSPLSTNNWYHVLYTVDSNGSIAYINGNQIASGAKATGSVRGDGSSDSNGNQYIFCSRGGNNNYWKGGIREVIIEKRKRSAEDVTSYYNRIKAKLGF